MAVLKTMDMNESEQVHCCIFSKRQLASNNNGTQETTPFSNLVFHALPRGVVRSVPSTSSRKRPKFFNSQCVDCQSV